MAMAPNHTENAVATGRAPSGSRRRHAAATEIAGEMMEALTLQRNRERQAAITGELLDIVGGANAL